MCRVVRIAIVGALALGACDRATEPEGSGVLALEILSSPGTGTVLDSGRIHVEGPTDQTVSITPGATVTITELLPGSYTVSLEGFLGDAVDRFGQTTGIQVVAGQNTQAAVTLASFQPVLAPFVPNSVTGKNFTATYSAVTGAASYRVDVATDNGFTNVVTTLNSSGTSTPVTVPEYGEYFVRVRAIDPFGADGTASGVESVSSVPPIVTLVSCLDGTPGDRIDRGFYVPSFLGVSLTRVDLFLSSSTLGTYTFELTARSGTFDGPAIGVGSATVDLGGGEVQTAFAFSDAEVTEGTTVTFALTQVSGPSDIVFYSVPGDNPSCPVIQTNGTEPPLSTMRRNGVKITIEGGQP
jgi:hypothetical protein